MSTPIKYVFIAELVKTYSFRKTLPGAYNVVQGNDHLNKVTLFQPLSTTITQIFTFLFYDKSFSNGKISKKPGCISVCYNG